MTPAPLRIALFGAELRQSRSGELFRALEAAGGPKVEHLMVEVAPGGMPRVMQRLRQGEWDGAHVTIPYKVEAAELVDELDAPASRAGAANTILRRAGGQLRGVNTDGPGFVAGLAALPGAERLDWRRGAPALVLGAGGAARGVATALVDKGAEVTIVSRDPDRAAAWASVLGADVLGWNDPDLPDAVHGARLMVQTTPLGSAPAIDHEPSLPWREVGAGHLAVDLIYNPWQTRFLERARERGARGINGWPMLVQQAVLAITLWSGPAAGRMLLEAAARLESRDPSTGDRNR